MKRESEDEDFLAQLEVVEKRELKIRRIQHFSKNVFVVLEGVNHGLYTNFEDVKRIDGHKKGHLYKKFARSADAVNWYRSATDLPRYSNPNAIVYLSGCCYDVTQDKDVFAAVCCMSNRITSFCKPANWLFNSNTLSYALLEKVLLSIPTDLQKVRLVIDCPQLAFGIKYGLWAYPKMDIMSPPTEQASKLYQRIQQQKMEVAHCIEGNSARKLVKKMSF